MNTVNGKRVFGGAFKRGQGELELLPAPMNEVELPAKVGDVVESMGNPVVRAQLASDAWWRGCKWDD